MTFLKQNNEIPDLQELKNDVKIVPSLSFFSPKRLMYKIEDVWTGEYSDSSQWFVFWTDKNDKYIMKLNRKLQRNLTMKYFNKKPIFIILLCFFVITNANEIVKNKVLKLQNKPSVIFLDNGEKVIADVLFIRENNFIIRDLQGIKKIIEYKNVQDIKIHKSENSRRIFIYTTSGILLFVSFVYLLL